LTGQIKVKYCVICKNDANIEISISDILSNEKISKVIKSEFAKGLRNINLFNLDDATVSIRTDKMIYELILGKNDFADLLVLAEEDAQKKKLFKKDCDGIELIDIVTVD